MHCKLYVARQGAANGCTHQSSITSGARNTVRIQWRAPCAICFRIALFSGFLSNLLLLQIYISHDDIHIAKHIYMCIFDISTLCLCSGNCGVLELPLRTLTDAQIVTTKIPKSCFRYVTCSLCLKIILYRQPGRRTFAAPRIL